MKSICIFSGRPRDSGSSSFVEFESSFPFSEYSNSADFLESSSGELFSVYSWTLFGLSALVTAENAWVPFIKHISFQQMNDMYSQGNSVLLNRFSKQSLLEPTYISKLIFHNQAHQFSDKFIPVFQILKISRIFSPKSRDNIQTNINQKKFENYRKIHQLPSLKINHQLLTLQSQFIRLIMNLFLILIEASVRQPRRKTLFRILWQHIEFLSLKFVITTDKSIMSKGIFNLESMNDKLGSVLVGNKGRFKKKIPPTTNCSSLAHSRKSVPKNINDNDHPIVNSFCSPRNMDGSSAKKKKRLSEPYTERKSKDFSINSSRLKNLSEELSSALESNAILEQMITRLQEEKTQAQNEQKRVAQQLFTLTESQNTIIQLRDSTNEKLLNLQSSYEEEYQKNRGKQDAFQKQILLLKQKLKEQRDQKDQIILDKDLQLSIIKDLEKDLVRIKNQHQNVKSQNFQTEKENLEAVERIKQTQRSKEQLHKNNSFMQKKIQEMKKDYEQSIRQMIVAQKKINQIMSKSSQQQHKAHQAMEHLQKNHILQIQAVKNKMLQQIKNLIGSQKEAIKKLEQSHNKKVRDIQDISACEMIVKEKQIDLLKISTASDIQKVKSQVIRLGLQLSQKDSIIKGFQKQIYSLNCLISNHEETESQLQEEISLQRGKIEEMEQQICKLNRSLTDARLYNDKQKFQKSSFDNAIKAKDKLIYKFQKENTQLTQECSELVQKLEKFCIKVQQLQTHMKCEIDSKNELQNRLNDQQIKVNFEIKKRLELQDTIANLANENVQLRRSAKESKMRLKISEDRLRELQNSLDQSNEQLTNAKDEMEKLENQTRKPRQLENLRKSLQNKDQLTRLFRQELQKQRAKNELLMNQLKNLKDNSQMADSALRLIDMNIINEPTSESRLQKMTI